MDPVDLEKAQSKVLKENFEVYLGREVERRRQRGYPEISQARVNSLLSEYQLRTGLSSELQGLLNIMEKDTYTARQLRDFFNANPRFMGGQVTLQHILIQHRDGGTGILLNGDFIKPARSIHDYEPGRFEIATHLVLVGQIALSFGPLLDP